MVRLRVRACIPVCVVLFLELKVVLCRFVRRGAANVCRRGGDADAVGIGAVEGGGGA